MKKQIIEGQFDRFSNGTNMDRMNLHEFVEIGGKRYTKVIWSDYMDSFMREALGKKIKLSVAKMHGAYVVGAVQYNGKVEKEVNAKPFASGFFGALLWTLVIPFAVACVVGSVAGQGRFIGAWIVAGVIGIAYLLSSNKKKAADVVNALD